MSAKQSDTDKTAEDTDKAAEDAVVNKLRGGVAQTDLSADELAAFARVTARESAAAVPATAPPHVTPAGQ